MATYMPADQYDEPFVAKHLANWEVPALKTKRPNSRVQPRSERTKFIVDERGHVLPGIPKKMTAFAPKADGLEGRPHWSPPRWPSGDDSHCSQFTGPRKGTMGYKGILTDYLPRNTTVIPSVLDEPSVIPLRNSSMGSSFGTTVRVGNNAGKGLQEGWPVSPRTLKVDKGRTREFNYH